ncbi:MAG TPA: hypothetical protein VHG71_13180 [Verrucomicrobiae bacterium]|nr:hypothetical protein [Verrucomicrobiae bacterium]
MKLRWKILIGIEIVVVLTVLISVVRHYQLRFAVDKYISELKAKGEPLELAQVIPPPVPPEQNAVPLIINTLTNFENAYNIIETNPPSAMRVVASGKAMIGWRQPIIVGFDEIGLGGLLTNSWEDLESTLAAAKDNLNCLQNLTNHPALDFNLDYGKIYSVQLRHLYQLKVAAQSLGAEALYDLHERKTSEACANVRLILVLVKGEAEERLEISQLVRSALANIVASLTWEILQDPNVSESDLAMLQHDWESIEFLDAAKKSFLAERVVNLLSMEHYLQNPSDLWNGVNGNDQEISRKLCKFYWQWFGVYSDEKRMMQAYQVLADATQMTETNHSFQSAKSFVRTNFDQIGFEKWHFPEEGTFRIDIDPFGVWWLLSEDAFDSFQLLRRASAIETAKNMTLAAIALKRYELQHREFPSSLDDLEPEFLKVIPLDYMNGKPLRYKLNSDGTFLLYSVGENGVDEGGKPTIHKWWEFYWLAHDFDLVWPQPATEAEIQNYFAHPPK